MTRLQITNMIIDQFSGRTDKATSMGFSIDNALKEIGQRHDFQALKDVQTDIDILSLNIDISSAAWTTADKKLTANFTSYTWASGDMILITGGTSITNGWFEIASATTSYVMLSTSIGSSDASDVSASWIGTPQWVSLPSGTSKVHEAILINGATSFLIDIRSKQYVDSLYPNPEYALTSFPYLAYRMQSKLYLAPYITTDYQVRLTTTLYPTLASADASKPTLVGVENCLIARVLMDLYAGEEFPTASTHWERMYEKTFKMLVENDERKPGTRYRAEPFFSNSSGNAVNNIDSVIFGGR